MAREQTLQLLETLFARRHDAVCLHDAWAGRLRSRSCQKTVRAMGLIHGVRSLELVRSAQLMGGIIRNPSPQQLRRGLTLRTTLAAVRGDRALMRRIEATQAELVRAYSAALEDPSSRPVRKVLERHLTEEQRHLAWLGYRRGELSKTPPSSRGTATA